MQRTRVEYSRCGMSRLVEVEILRPHSLILSFDNTSNEHGVAYNFENFKLLLLDSKSLSHIVMLLKSLARSLRPACFERNKYSSTNKKKEPIYPRPLSWTKLCFGLIVKIEVSVGY